MTDKDTNKKDPGKNKAGHWKKGVSGNPTGRPKTEKLTAADKKELKGIIDKKDISELLGFMCERATTVNDAFRYVKEFAPYLAPKLQSIQNVSKVDNTITIEWKTEVLKKIEDIDGEYEKLVGPREIPGEEKPQESHQDMDTDTYGN